MHEGKRETKKNKIELFIFDFLELLLNIRSPNNRPDASCGHGHLKLTNEAKVKLQQVVTGLSMHSCDVTVFLFKFKLETNSIQ